MKDWFFDLNPYFDDDDEEEITAEWEKINEYTYKCSNCGYPIIYGKWSVFLNTTLLKPKWCDSCGCEMRG